MRDPSQLHEGCPPRCPTFPGANELLAMFDDMLETAEGRAELPAIIAKWDEIDRHGGLQ